MEAILYVGDDEGAAIMKDQFTFYNDGRGNVPKSYSSLSLDTVPVGCDFPTGTPEGLKAWLQNKVPEFQARQSYAAIVVDLLYSELIPAIKEVHPKTPVVVSAGIIGQKIKGADRVFGIYHTARIPYSLEGILAQNRKV